MDQFVTRLNIAHYRELLETTRDPARRRTLLQLLAEEEAKGSWSMPAGCYPWAVPRELVIDAAT